MSIPIIKVKASPAVIHSIYSGAPVFTEDGPSSGDETVLFSYVGDAGEWNHVSDRLLTSLKRSREELDRFSPRGVCRRLTIPGAICIEFDQDWNGLLYVAFAPRQEDE